MSLIYRNITAFPALHLEFKFQRAIMIYAVQCYFFLNINGINFYIFRKYLHIESLSVIFYYINLYNVFSYYIKRNFMITFFSLMEVVEDYVQKFLSIKRQLSLRLCLCDNDISRFNMLKFVYCALLSQVSNDTASNVYITLPC